MLLACTLHCIFIALLRLGAQTIRLRFLSVDRFLRPLRPCCLLRLNARGNACADLRLPLPAGSGTAFAFGLLPVGDAFVAWARSAPLGAALDVPSPQPWFWLFWLLALVPGVVALWMCRRRIAGLVALRRPGSAGRREECQHIKDGASEPGGSVMNETTVGR